MLAIPLEKLSKQTMNSPVLIIAEAGVNHNGSLELAKQLVDAAVEAGVDYVKFQTFKAEKIASKLAGKADYQKQTTAQQESQVAMLKKLELSEVNHFELIDYCKSKNIHFLSTPFDLDSIDFLKSIGIKLGKIPSGEITNLPYLRKMARSFDHIIMSTGMTDMTELKAALKVLLNEGLSKENITILHCNTEYPTPMQDVNLLAMKTIAKQTGVKIGYSDHTLGIEIPIAAVALGATLIEMVKGIRNIEKAISGTGEKTPSVSETKNKQIARKSIVAATDIKKNAIFTEENLTTKRPGNGISPMKWDTVIGRKAKRDFFADELIEL
jgi:N,N'-diacetyllegionaminate synthase